MSFIGRIVGRIPELLSPQDLRYLDRIIHEVIYKKYGYPEHEHYAYWERQAQYWTESVPPIRPSNKEIEVFRSHVRGAGDINNILILGSTPEIRDLIALESNANVYVADFSFNMIVSMLAHTKDVNQLDEKWVKDNWLELAFPEEYFDLIIGDVVFHQLTPTYEDAFMQKMHGLLSKQGSFVTRFFFLDADYLNQDFSDIASETIRTARTARERTTLLRLQAVWSSTDLHTRTYDRRKALQLMEPIALSFPEDVAVLRAYHALENDVDSYRNWAPPTEARLFEIIDTYFRRGERQVADDYSTAKLFPIIKLMKQDC